MIINVTQEDINNGKISEARKCPITLAANRIFGDNHVITGITGILYNIVNNKTECYLLPQEAREFIQNFDSEFPVKPFMFEIKLINNGELTDQQCGILYKKVQNRQLNIEMFQPIQEKLALV